MPPFIEHTVESAPPGARKAMAAVTDHLGYLPAAVARMATAPELLNSFLRMTAITETTTLDPISREVIVMAIATRNRCHVCVAMHSAALVALGVGADLIQAARDGKPLPDARLEALREFTHELIDTSGAVEPERLRAFLDHGYSERNALEVILLIGTYTLSTLANRLTDAPLDPAIVKHAWNPPTH